MTVDELERAKREIQNSYLAQLGLSSPAGAASTLGGAEAEARRLIDEIKTIEASGGDASRQRSRLAALRAQVRR